MVEIASADEGARGSGAHGKLAGGRSVKSAPVQPQQGPAIVTSKLQGTAVAAHGDIALASTELGRPAVFCFPTSTAMSTLARSVLLHAIIGSLSIHRCRETEVQLAYNHNMTSSTASGPSTPY